MKDYAIFAHVLLIETNNNRHEILSSQDVIHWKTILDSTYDFLMKNNMWWLEDLPKDWLGEQGINSEIWKKYNLDGSVAKLKIYRKINSSRFLPNIRRSTLRERRQIWYFQAGIPWLCCVTFGVLYHSIILAYCCYCTRYKSKYCLLLCFPVCRWPNPNLLKKDGNAQTHFGTMKCTFWNRHLVGKMLRIHSSGTHWLCCIMFGMLYHWRDLSWPVVFKGIF